MSSFARKMAIYRRKSQISSPPEVQLKLTRLVKRHEEMKIAYHRLKDQIDDGLLQAEEVFASLAIPLIKLVGLKTVEMAEEGRFTTITVDTAFAHKSQEYGIGAESPVVTGDRNDQIGAVEGERCATKVTMVGKELVDKRRMQLFHLVQLLRKIETEVNSNRDDILQTLDNHNASLYKLFQKAICYISALHGQNHDVLFATLHLLQVIFKNVSAALGSVKDGVEDLMQDLSEHMCNPMVEYVKRLKDEIKHGTLVRLLEMVEEMEKVMRDGSCELEDARKKARVAEEKRIEALCKLEAAKDEARKMKEHLKPLLEAKVEKRIDLVYGGESLGLMGVLSQKVRDGGRHVIGVVPKSLVESIFTPEPVGEVVTVNNLHERKALMACEADAFIGLPRGYGTLEELLEVISGAPPNIYSKPVGLLNVDGFFNSLLSLIDKAVDEGFISPIARPIVVSAPTPKQLLTLFDV